MKALMMFAAGAVMLGLCGLRAEAGQGQRPEGPRGGMIQEIIDHATELGLSAEQKTKLEALQKETHGGMRDKMKDNPNAREIVKEMREARQSGDDAKIAAAREKMTKEAGDGKPGEKAGEMREKLEKIMTPEQMAKVKDIMKAGREKMKEGGGRAGRGGEKESQGQKPDSSKEAPKVFE